MIKTRGRTRLKDSYREGIQARLRTKKDDRGRYARYRNDLASFPQEELGIPLITPDQEQLARSVIEYPVTVVMSATGVGKTFALAFIAIALYKSRANIEIYTAAAPPESNLRKLLWGEIGRIVGDNPHVFEEDNIKSLEIERKNKQFIAGVTIPQGSEANNSQVETKFSGKHQKNLIFIFDEGDAIPDAVYKAADGCMSGGWARMVICFNPRKKSGAVYRMIKEHRAHVISMSAMDHPNVVTGEDIVPGAVTREKTVQRINEWCEWLPPELAEDYSESVQFTLPDFLVGAVAKTGAGEEFPPLRPGQYKVNDNQFWYKVLGLFPPTVESQLIGDEYIDQARANWDLYVAKYGEVPPKGVEPTMGLDVADMGVDNNVCALLYGNYVPRLQKWSGVDPDMTASRAIRIYREEKCRRAHVDSIGVGAGVPGKMSREGCRGAVGVKITETSRGYTEEGEFASIYDESYWALRTWFRSGNAMIPPDDRLEESLRAITYEVVGMNVVVEPKRKLAKRLDYSPDEMEALMLNFSPANTLMWEM